MESRELRGSVYGKQPFAVIASLELYDRPTRIRRALKISLPLFLVGLPLLPIPGLHLSLLVLWPLAVLLGVREEQRIIALEGRCGCERGPQAYELPDRLALPLTLRCPGCSEFVKVGDR